MKWMLFVLVFGSYPVETDLKFDSLDACLKAEQTSVKRGIRRSSAGMIRKLRQPAFRTDRR